MEMPTDLNPIFEYAAKGRYFEKLGKWEKALQWYHRTLASFPNRIGMDKQIRPLPRMKSGPLAFTPRHAARMYAALGRCLLEMDRGQDCLLAFRAARLLDPENISVQRFFRDEKLIPGYDPSGLNSGDRCAADRPGASQQQNLQASLTLLMVTHCTKKLKRFEMLSPPSCGLVTTTYGSLIEVFGDEISRCPKVLCYDAAPICSALEIEYSRSLERFVHQQGFQLYRFPGIGLFNVLNRAISMVTTPYILFVEHDWLFQGPGIRLSAIVDLMDRHPNMHSVRFNKRDNYINGQDYIVHVVESQESIPVLRTSAFSNNPGIIRTEKLKEEWLPMCERALDRVCGKMGGTAFGIEEILFRRQVKSIRCQGFDKAHEQWGTFIFGGAGAPRRIVHLGE